MNRFGVFFILIGILVLISLWFLSEYHFKAGYVYTIQEKQITLKGENLLGELGIIEKGQKVVIPCKLVFGAGVIMFLVGLFAVVLHHNPREK